MKNIIIKILDKIFNDLCWAELVLWANNVKSCWDTFGFNGSAYSQYCRKGRKGCPHAYCGKCEKTGNFYKKDEECEKCGECVDGIDIDGQQCEFCNN